MSVHNAKRPPVQIPDHVLLHRVGTGSYGEVWLARNTLGTFRAVKVIYRDAFDNDRPYEREFQGLKLFEPLSRTHDGLVDILHLGRNDTAGYFYYVMEAADDACQGGQINPADYTPLTLSEVIRRRSRLPIKECLRLGALLAGALEHLHQGGLSHRDVKPSNIIFVQGVPKLADIGLVAKAGEARTFVGTSGFIPPEGPGTAQADVYSLGKVLYEMSTGKDRQEFPSPPTEIADSPDCAQFVQLNNVLVRACHPDPRGRYRSAAALRADLEVLSQGKRLLPHWTRPRQLTKGVALLVLGLLACYAAIQRAGDQPPSKADVILEDDFRGYFPDTNRWTTNQTDRFSSRLPDGLRRWSIRQEDGALQLSCYVQHTNGYACTQLAWVDSVVDLKGLGDLQIDLEFEASASWGPARCLLTDGLDPETTDDPRSVELCGLRPEDPRELHKLHSTSRIQVFVGAQMAVVEGGLGGPRLADLSSLPKWRLRFLVSASTSSGFPPAETSLAVRRLCVRRVPKRTYVFGVVRDRLSQRPLSDALVKRIGYPDSPCLRDGKFLLEVPPGPLQLSAQKAGYRQPVPVRLEVQRDQVQRINLELEKQQLQVGDVLESFPFPLATIKGIEMIGDTFYYFGGETNGHCGFYSTNLVSGRVSTLGRAGMPSQLRHDTSTSNLSVAGLTCCDNDWILTAGWPGRILRLSGSSFELVRTFHTADLDMRRFLPGPCENQLAFPLDVAWDGRSLWLVEGNLIAMPSGTNRMVGLWVMDLTKRQLTRRLELPPDLELRGLAWDGRQFWASSTSGKVLALNTNALEKGFVVADRSFDGQYEHLAYANGYLWGVDSGTRRICKILLAEP